MSPEDHQESTDLAAQVAAATLAKLNAVLPGPELDRLRTLFETSKQPSAEQILDVIGATTDEADLD